MTIYEYSKKNDPSFQYAWQIQTEAFVNNPSSLPTSQEKNHDENILLIKFLNR